MNKSEEREVFEIYAVINDTMNIGPDIYHICQNILQISVTLDGSDLEAQELKLIIIINETILFMSLLHKLQYLFF